jgi:hypothetical protein
LSGHPDWYYNDGQVGRSKWWKHVGVGTGEIHVTARAYADGGGYSEYAILAYKGANFASLTNASTDEAVDAVMMGYGPAYAENVGPSTDDFMDIPYTNGETVWICLVGIYDADGPGGNTGTASAVDCPQCSLDLELSLGVPVNDLRTAFVQGGLLEIPQYYLGRSEWGDYLNEGTAFLSEGTTVAATTSAEDPATIGGFACARTVWYFLEVAEPGSWKIWIESAVDCVLGIWEDVFSSFNLGTLIAQDDDSGPGNQPEITTTLTNGGYWIGVDSKTEGNFTLKVQKVAVGSPPANDDFDDAVLISSLPFSVQGTTINATAEPGDRENQTIGLGPKDTVWYKYVAPANGVLNVYATCDTFNDDAYVGVSVWKGTTLTGLTRAIEPWPLNKGWFTYFDSALVIASKRLTVPLVSGETYYIRVDTESGGSEDFTVFVDAFAVMLDLQVSSQDVGPITDTQTVYLDLQPLSSEFQERLILDSATVYLDLQNLGGECLSTYSGVLIEGEADLRWATESDQLRWLGEDELRWSEGEILIEGINC